MDGVVICSTFIVLVRSGGNDARRFACHASSFPLKGVFAASRLCFPILLKRVAELFTSLACNVRRKPIKVWSYFVATIVGSSDR